MEQVRLLRQDEIECRVGTINEKGLSLLLYKDARADMKILDETYGPMNWKRTHKMVGESLYCIVSVWDDTKQQWITKMDVGTESYTEKEKGRASDSFKRACVSLGIGRELYSAPFIWIPAEKAGIRKEGNRYSTNDRFSVKEISYGGNRSITALSIINGKKQTVFDWAMQKKQDSPGSTAAISGEQAALLEAELKRTGVTMETVKKRYGVGEPGRMSEEVYGHVMQALSKTKSRNEAA